MMEKRHRSAGAFTLAVLLACVVICCAGCSATAASSGSLAPASGASAPVSVAATPSASLSSSEAAAAQPSASQPPDNGGTSFPPMTNEAEIIAACTSYFDSISMGTLVTEPFSSPLVYTQRENGNFNQKVLTHNQLRQLNSITPTSVLYGEESIPCYPATICNQLTQEMFGLTFTWADTSLNVPEGSFVMPYGYGGTMVTTEISQADCSVEGNQIYLTATLYWNDFGAEPTQIGHLLYQFTYTPQNEFCPFTLMSLHEV